MRRFPRPSHTEPLTDGCLSTGILLVLTALCPPIGIIFLIGYGIYKNHEESINNIMAIILFGVILILSPIAVIFSFFINGFIETIKEYSVLVFITLIEVIVIFVVLLKDKINFKPKPIGTGSHILIAITFGVLTICLVKKAFSGNSEHVIELLFFSCCSSIPSLNSMIKLLGETDKTKTEINSKQHKSSGEYDETFKAFRHEFKPSKELQDMLDDYHNKYGKEIEESSIEQHSELTETELSINSTNTISSGEINTDENKTIVFITPHGKKYHCSECQCIKNRNDLIEITISKAENKGCTPCGMCCKNNIK